MGTRSRDTPYRAFQARSQWYDKAASFDPDCARWIAGEPKPATSMLSSPKFDTLRHKTFAIQ
jgi:hypothetical protein